MTEEIRCTKVRLRAHIRKHPKLENMFNLITSIIGVGEMTASVIIGELGYLEGFTSIRQVEVHCGLAPKVHQSGTSVNKKGHLSKRANDHVRRALFMPALSAMRSNPLIIEFSMRLKESGKPGKLIVCAVMRKLLRWICSIVKSGKPFSC